MRRNTCSNSAGLCVDVSTRCRVWQPTHMVRNAFCLGSPGRLLSHSPLDNCVTRFLTGLSLRSAVAVAPAATSALFGPSSL